jgi:hypothetical protein
MGHCITNRCFGRPVPSWEATGPRLAVSAPILPLDSRCSLGTPILAASACRVTQWRSEYFQRVRPDFVWFCVSSRSGTIAEANDSIFEHRKGKFEACHRTDGATGRRRRRRCLFFLFAHDSRFLQLQEHASTKPGTGEGQTQYKKIQEGGLDERTVAARLCFSAASSAADQCFVTGARPAAKATR